MIRLDLNAACHMACTAMIEIHLEKGVSLLGLFPPIGAREDFSTADTTTARPGAPEVYPADGIISRGFHIACSRSGH